MTQKPFQKFIQTGESGARKKERIRQDKKRQREETKSYFAQKKQAVRSQRISTADVPEQSGTSKRTHPSNMPRRGPGTKPVLTPKPLPGKKNLTSSPAATTKGPMPLNKYIAHCGVCSRRDAAEWVKSGKVTVNQNRILEPGFKVTAADEVRLQGKLLQLKKELVYILLNKPKDYITTTEDDKNRKTVLDLVRKATSERVYPVGRLDRNTTGVLMLTNDGDLAQKLSHPSYEIKKIYEVTLDRQLSKKDFDTIEKGLQLEDGFIAPDALAWPDAKNKHIVGIEIHSGRNRIVRRIFEQLGYTIKNLDRVLYANLSKKNVDRGRWRFLSEKEV
ncbi:MAG: pseudouridine synthase, partial [Chitinophagaceae bacterium]